MPASPVEAGGSSAKKAGSGWRMPSATFRERRSVAPITRFWICSCFCSNMPWEIMRYRPFSPKKVRITRLQRDLHRRRTRPAKSPFRHMQWVAKTRNRYKFNGLANPPRVGVALRQDAPSGTKGAAVRGCAPFRRFHIFLRIETSLTDGFARVPLRRLLSARACRHAPVRKKSRPRGAAPRCAAGGHNAKQRRFPSRRGDHNACRTTIRKTAPPSTRPSRP